MKNVSLISLFALISVCSHGATVRTATEAFVTNAVYTVYTNLNAAATNIKASVESIGADVDSLSNDLYSVWTNLESVVTNGIQEKTVAMFILPLNDFDPFPTDSVGNRIGWGGVCLKCSTNNFQGVGTGGMSYFYKSSDMSGYGSGTDSAELLVMSALGDDNRKEFLNISTTDQYAHDAEIWDFIAYSGEIVLLVSRENCMRTDGKWLSDKNESLVWSWCRLDSSDIETRKNVSSGGYEEWWRPVMPARWLGKIPEWAKKMKYPGEWPIR